MASITLCQFQESSLRDNYAVHERSVTGNMASITLCQFQESSLRDNYAVHERSVTGNREHTPSLN